MYSFEPNEEQQMLVDVVRNYAQNVLRPAAHDAEENKQFPLEIIQSGWELGVLQASLPENFGGFGERSVLTNILAAEAMAHGDLAGLLAVNTTGLFAVPILEVGSRQQKEDYLSMIAGGPWQSCTAAVIEPKLDFDLNEMQTRAHSADDGYVLNGKKAYVPFADQAETLLVYADFEGQTQAFIVPSSAVGLKIGEREKTLGMQALPMFKVELDGVKVPFEKRLGGKEGHEFETLANLLFVSAAAAAVGVAQASLDFAVEYAKERVVFGVKVAQKQAIAFMIAEMDAQIEATRLLTWEAAWKIDNKKADAAKAAYLAYLGSVDMAMFVTDCGVQILGGHGYIREFPVELWYRNGRMISILPGLLMV